MNFLFVLQLYYYINRLALKRDTTNSTEKFRGIYTVGWNFCRKRPNTVGKDQHSVLSYAPAPKTHGNFTVFLLTIYI
jgi:hypothetical protein